ncbi:hypothetical protein K7X08_036959 [Anisodus acutangulus]|uniref:TF-B3 domain-containing protein n=1 Tax=Anisodus acutangulus TaxID=402998 RepID=A0A9Q1QWF1_9SOLA|nr:hypothetical protein K7X08_036959 [Anisodus acutangulus]
MSMFLSKGWVNFVRDNGSVLGDACVFELIKDIQPDELVLKENMEKGFFKFFSPENSSKRLKIPTAYTDYKNGKLPRKVSLRDRFDNMWPIGVTKTGRNFHFQYGWEKFIKENTIEFGDFLTFEYDGNGVFDFKLLGTTGCEKKGSGGLKLDVKEEDEEGMNVEHQKSEVPKRKWRSDSSSSDDSDEDDEDYVVEEEEEEEKYDVVDEEIEEEKNERATKICKKKEPHSKGRRVEEEDDDDKEEEYKEEEEQEKEGEDDDEDEYEETEEEEEWNERASIFKKMAPRLERRFAEEEEDDEEEECDEETKEEEIENEIDGWHIQEKGAMFKSWMQKCHCSQAKRRDQLYVPVDVVRDYKLKLPSSMTIRDPVGRKFETKLKSWKDGRMWLHGGWHNLCRWNLVGKDDSCICEFVRGKGKKSLYLQVQVLYEGASSRPSKNN